MKKLLLIMLAVLSLSTHVFAYETNVHWYMSEYAVNNSVISDYLKKNLDISLDAEFNKRSGREWIKEGSRWEDGQGIEEYLALRWLNHFYDPTTGKGLNPCVTTLCSPSLQWGKDSSENAWSWKWARDSYYKALTDSNPKYRETYFSYVFRALGQVIHLVHDLAVPAHVRNDPHGAPIIKYDLYEEYTRDRANSLSYSGYPPVDIKTFNILDKFWVNSGYGLSEYTNTNFFSRDTIFKNYPHPARENTNFSDFGLLPITVITTPGNINHNTFYISGYGKRYLAGMKYLAEEIWGLPIPFKYQLSLILDDRCHEEYAQHLIPRAVGYSAGLLNYFFRGEMNMVPDDATGSGYVIVNNTDEDMDGTFALWYDKENGDRAFVKSWSLKIYKQSSGNNKSSNITFTPPTDAKEPNKYMLVFRGKLGNEEDAVVAQKYECECEFIHEIPDNILYGNSAIVLTDGTILFFVDNWMEGQLILYKSKDCAETWASSVIVEDVPQVTVAMSKQLENGEIISGYDFGYIIKSSDNGITWRVIDLGYPWNLWCNYATYEATIVIVVGFRIYRSTDWGETWQNVLEVEQDEDGINWSWFRDVIRLNNGTYLAFLESQGTKDGKYMFKVKIYKFTDGINWTVQNQVDGYNIYRVIERNGIIFASGSSLDEDLQYFCILKSNDEGLSWQKIFTLELYEDTYPIVVGKDNIYFISSVNDEAYLPQKIRIYSIDNNITIEKVREMNIKMTFFDLFYVTSKPALIISGNIVMFDVQHPTIVGIKLQ